ncbi:hypothetical protein BB561_006204 [Smittium simulii]|uniref:Uncharacterized protein n=1 Tax=Smittium simulii TaxID=133385 RepID=A0A2T9Y5X8_9FUNG|nr:hypothetical protein BB561_006204 [Smittium simulii]
MNEATLQRIEELTEKVNQLLLAKETVPAPITVTEPEDEFITTRAPASKLKIYPMLKDALPSIEEDFFRIQLTEEERKDAIYSCPRSSFMNYLPPPLNESASTAVKKADSTLHGIQVALAQATRPYFVLFVISNAPSASQSATDVLLLPSEKRTRVEYSIEKHTGLINTITKNNYNFDLKSKNNAKNQTRSSIYNEISVKHFLNDSAPAKLKQMALVAQISVLAVAVLRAKKEGKTMIYYQESNKNKPRGCGSSSKESNQTGKDYNTRFLQSNLCYNKKDRRPTYSPGPQGAQQLCQEEEFQNGFPDIHMQDDHEKGLYDLSEPRGRFYAHSDTLEVQEISLFSMEREDFPILCSSVWTFTETSNLYKDATPSTKLGPISKNQSLGILGQSFNNRQVQEKIYREYKKIIPQIKSTGVQDQDGEVQYDIISIYYSYGDDDKLTNYEFKSPIRQGEGSQTRGQQTDQSWQNNTEKLGKLYWKSTSNEAFGIEKQFLERSEIMCCHGDYEQSSNSELRILETESAKIEQSIQYGMGNSCWIPVLFRIVAPIDNISPHKRQGIISSVLRSTTRSVVGCSILVYSDNTTSLAYVQKFEEMHLPNI